jgi:hypothetical protein
MAGCSPVGADGRQISPAVVLPQPNGTLIAGLAPDDVSSVDVIDDEGVRHKVDVVGNGWTTTLPSGRQVTRFELQHANGRVEALGG